MDAYQRDVKSALSPTALSRTRHRRAYDPFRTLSPQQRQAELENENAQFGNATLGPSDVELLRQLRKEAHAYTSRQRSREASHQHHHQTVRDAFRAGAHLSTRTVAQARDAILAAGSPKASKHRHQSPSPTKSSPQKRGRRLVRHTVNFNKLEENDDGGAAAAIGITKEGIDRVRRFRDRHPYLTFSPEYFVHLCGYMI